MSDSHIHNVPDEGERIADPEQLARFVFRHDQIRQDQTVKPDLFIPHPHAELSVTRHAALNDSQIWERGDGVAAAIGRLLLGRADLTALAVRAAALEPVIAWREHNPEHAHIVGWPSGKPNQKHQAQLLARDAKFSKRPEVHRPPSE